jgi:hypothetical protein
LLLDLFVVLKFELDVVQGVVGLEGQLVVLAVEGGEITLEEIVSLPQLTTLILPFLSHLNFRLNPVEFAPDFSSDSVSVFEVSLHFEDLLLEGRILAGEECQGTVDLLHRVGRKSDGFGVDLRERVLEVVNRRRGSSSHETSSRLGALCLRLVVPQ